MPLVNLILILSAVFAAAGLTVLAGAALAPGLALPAGALSAVIALAALGLFLARR